MLNRGLTSDCVGRRALVGGLTANVTHLDTSRQIDIELMSIQYYTIDYNSVCKHSALDFFLKIGYHRLYKTPATR